jgi:maleate cis-trans isomerase
MRVGVQRASSETPLETGFRLVSICARVLSMRARVGVLSLQRKTGVNNLHETHAPVHAAAHALSDADAEVDAHVCSHARTGTTPTESRNAIPACRSSAGIESSMLRSTSSTAALQRHMSLDRRPQC